MFSALFSSRKRTPTAVVVDLREAVAQAKMAPDGRTAERSREDIAKHLSALKVFLFGDDSTADKLPTPNERDVAEIVKLACREDLLMLLTENLRLMGFETRKDAVQIFNNLLRQEMDNEDRDEHLSEMTNSLSLRGDMTSVAGGGIGDVSSHVSSEGNPDKSTNNALLNDERANQSTVSTPKPGCECRRAVDQAAKSGETLMTTLIAYYDDSEIALNAGAMLRECLRDEMLAQILLEADVFWRFFDLVEKNDFDVASDAFTSFKDVLTRHQQVAASFMQANLDIFVKKYNGLMRSSNYVTRRQSLKLLGEMLMERANFSIMTKYIASTENLKLIMNLLLDNRRNIQFEAFHVFKVFVANPNKPPEVYQILLRNRDRLLVYLSDFLLDRDDEQFHADRLQIIEEIEALS